MKRHLVYLLPAVFILSVVGPTMAKIINVPAEQPTIQAGINTAVDYDTVLVAPGTYFENIIFPGKDIVVSSHFALDGDRSYITSTIIDGSAPVHPDTGSCVRIVEHETRAAVIQGFTITHGNGTIWDDEAGAGYFREGGGILCTYASPTIQFNIIIGCDESVHAAFTNMYTILRLDALVFDKLYNNIFFRFYQPFT